MYKEKAEVKYADTHDILQEIADELNLGQTKKLLKNEKIKEHFEFFKVQYKK